MKKIKNLFGTLLTFVLLFASMAIVQAATGTLVIDGASEVEINKNIELTFGIKNLSDSTTGIGSVGGTIEFDTEHLEYVSFQTLSGDTINARYTKSSGKISGLAFDGDSALKGANVNFLKLTFKAIKEGDATVKLKNGEVSLFGQKTAVTTTDPTKTIKIGEAKNGDANLKSLGVTGQTLSPAFNPNTTSYTVTVKSDVTKVTVTGEVNASTSKVTGLGDYSLTGNTLSIPVKVTAENGTTKTYTINVKKETVTPPATKSSDADLKGLTVSGYDLSPAFNKGTTEYSVTVPNSADSVIINASPNHSKAKVEITGDKDLKVGDNKVTVKVTAEDGTVKTYTVNVKKEEKPDTSFKGDATLKNLEVENHTISPKFDPNSHAYVVNVGSDVDSIKILAEATDPKGTVSISGNTNLKEGVNTVIVRVTNEDGKTSDYVVNVVKEAKKEEPKPTTPSSSKSSDSYLKSLTINSAHTIDKVFDKNIQSYAITVPYEVEKLDLSYVKNNSKASVKITGNENFKVGVVNTVTITVNAEDGSTRLYLLNVIRSPEVSGTDLEKLVVNGTDIYKPNQTKYDVTIDSTMNKLDITAIPVDKDSKVEIIGNENLKEGKNTVWVKVTDKKGYEKLYEITVTKEAAKKKTGFLGLSGKTWGIILGILGFLLLLFLLLLLLLRKRKDEEEKAPIVINKEVPPTPVIEFKPEFNFGSKNSSDDDVVHGNMNQDSQLTYQKEEEAPKRLIEAEVRDAEEVPYDPFDETITKDEIVGAIHEAMKTKDTSKLRILLDQDELNQRKKEIKKKESRRRYEEDEDDYF